MLAFKPLKGPVMKRFIDYELQKWVTRRDRMPLIVRGPRHVGKTYSIRKMGKQCFDDVVEVNFELMPQIARIFEQDLDAKRIMGELSLVLNKTIIFGKTLIFFDEIQVVPDAFTSLRYFYEMIPEQPIIAASSLFGIATKEVGAPVGRVAPLYVYPMTFIEFLVAIGEDKLAQMILTSENFQDPIFEKGHYKALKYFAQYCAIGGMPDAVARWCQTGNFYEVEDAHNKIITSYKSDFQAYAQPFEVKYIEALFESIPQQLAQRFKYSLVKGGYRKRDLEPCLDYLEAAELTNRIYRDVEAAVPDIEYFKGAFVDVGLAQAILGQGYTPWFRDYSQALADNPSIVEAAIGQELYGYSNLRRCPRLECWAGFRQGSEARIDYLLPRYRVDIPIDVVTGKNKNLRSMLMYLRAKENVPYGIRFSEEEYAKKNTIYNYPLYAVAASFDDFKERAITLFSQGER